MRFKTKAWFQVIVNTTVKVTVVSFVCVTTVHATDYGSLQLSTILSKPDAEIVSDTAVISVSGTQMPLLDSVSASDDQAPGNVVIVESVLLSDDAPIADAVVILPIDSAEKVPVVTPVMKVKPEAILKPVPLVVPQIEKQASEQTSTMATQQEPAEPVSAKPVSVEPVSAVPVPAEPVPAEPVSVEKTSFEQLIFSVLQVVTASAKKLTLANQSAKTSAADPITLEPISAKPESVKTGSDNSRSDNSVSVEPLSVEPFVVQPVPVEIITPLNTQINTQQSIAEQNQIVNEPTQLPTPVADSVNNSSVNTGLVSTSQEKLLGNDAQMTSQTTLNQPSGKFKFNVVTDNMIDALNSIIPQNSAANAMSLETFHLIIAAAVNQHPEMLAVVEQTKVAGYVSSEAFGAYLPQISTSVDAGSRINRSSTSSALLPKGDGVDATMSVKQLLYDFGATSANYDSAKFKEQASLERMATKRSELSFRTISAYIELLRARLLYNLAQENYNSRLSILNMVKERYELGGGNKVDVIRAEARLTDASATKIASNISLQLAEAGYKEMFLQAPTETPLPQDVSIELANQSIDILSKKYGAVRETELGVKSLLSDAKAAESRMLPTLNFEVNGARRSQETYYGEYSETSAHLVMRYNLFTGGADSARKQQAVHRAEQMQQDLDNLILQVKKSIVQSTTQVNEAEGLVRVRREGVLGASQSLLAVKEHFTYRRGTLLDLLRSQEELYIAGRDYISSLMDRSISRYRLLHLTAALETMIPDLKSQ